MANVFIIQKSIILVIIFDNGNSMVIKEQISPMKVLEYIIDNHQYIDIDCIIGIIRLELSW